MASRRTVLRAANAVGVLGSGAFALVGAVSPAFDTPDATVTPLARFWAVSSAARSLSLTAPLLVALARSDDRTAAALLTVAGGTQLADAALGIWRRNPAMATVPTVAAALHLASARALG